MRIHPNMIDFSSQSSSKGNQTKCSFGDYWYKLDYLGYEAASEYIVSGILAQSNCSNYVKYDVVQLEFDGKEETVSISKDFLKGKELWTLDQLFKINYGKPPAAITKGLPLQEQIKTIVEMVEKSTGLTNFGAYLTCLLELDLFTLNEDRHFNNIAIIRDPDTEKFELCPIFDNGAAFMSDTMKDYPIEKDTYGLMNNVTAKPFSKSFDEQVEICEKLYGKQLVISNDLNLADQFQKIEECYGGKISTRMKTIIERQIYLYPELLGKIPKNMTSEKDDFYEDL